jgi:pimeloyl-ACP methyl ester carboxylesterase
MQTRAIDVGDLELVVAEAGAGGRPLLLCHGFTGAKEDFTSWLDPLGHAGWHAVAPDLRGHGDSPKPEGVEAYSLDVFAADLLGVLDALGWDRATILGHSMGGMVVQVLALKAPDRVRALVLMDTLHGPMSGLDGDILELGISMALEQGMDPVADVLELMAENDPLTSPAHVELMASRPDRKAQSDRNLRVSSPHLYASMLRSFPVMEERLDRLAELAMPTLVIVGEQDRPFVGPSKRMAEVIPGARLAVIADAGHSPQLENPVGWWEALGGFLDDIVTDQGD